MCIFLRQHSVRVINGTEDYCNYGDYNGNQFSLFGWWASEWLASQLGPDWLTQWISAMLCKGTQKERLADDCHNGVNNNWRKLKPVIGKPWHTHNTADAEAFTHHFWSSQRFSDTPWISYYLCIPSGLVTASLDWPRIFTCWLGCQACTLKSSLPV